MTAEDLIIILKQLPPDTEILMEMENGDVISPCFADSGVEEMSDGLGEIDLVYVMCPCHCGMEDLHEESFELQILENVN